MGEVKLCAVEMLHTEVQLNALELQEVERFYYSMQEHAKEQNKKTTLIQYTIFIVFYIAILINEFGKQIFSNLASINNIYTIF